MTAVPKARLPKAPVKVRRHYDACANANAKHLSADARRAG
jgi:hypothetical protein